VVCALLVKVSVAVSAPAVVGLNVTVKGTLAPTGIVAGSDKPLIVNAGLLLVAAVIVTIEPAAVTLPEAVPLLPTGTLPTLRVAGFTESCPGWAWLTPAPVSDRVTVGFAASLVIEAVALNVPTALGENVTVTVVLCPAATVTGRLGATSWKRALEIETLLTVTDAGPEFVATIDKVAVVSTATFPKFSVPFAKERVLPSWGEV
jgi:hypothetical protein